MRALLARGRSLALKVTWESVQYHQGRGKGRVSEVLDKEKDEQLEEGTQKRRPLVARITVHEERPHCLLNLAIRLKRIVWYHMKCYHTSRNLCFGHMQLLLYLYRITSIVDTNTLKLAIGGKRWELFYRPTVMQYSYLVQVLYMVTLRICKDASGYLDQQIIIFNRNRVSRGLLVANNVLGHGKYPISTNQPKLKTKRITIVAPIYVPINYG